MVCLTLAQVKHGMGHVKHAVHVQEQAGKDSKAQHDNRCMRSAQCCFLLTTMVPMPNSTSCSISACCQAKCTLVLTGAPRLQDYVSLLQHP